MSSALDLYLCLSFPSKAPLVFARLNTFLENGFYDKIYPALTRALPLRTGMKLYVPNRGDFRISTDSFGTPLTYLLPEDFDDFEGVEPHNQAMLDFITKSPHRLSMIVVLFWR